MSDSVNLRVVIFWIIFVVVLVGLALFGYFNQDLVKKTEDQPFIPVVNTENIKSCTASVERGVINYDFILKEDNSIKDLRVVYTATDGTIDDYAAATSLSKIDVLGINPSLQNEYNNFTLIVLLTINGYDTNTLVNYQQNLDDLNIIINNETSLDNYINALNNKYTSVNCVDQKN